MKTKMIFNNIFHFMSFVETNCSHCVKYKNKSCEKMKHIGMLNEMKFRSAEEIYREVCKDILSDK